MDWEELWLFSCVPIIPLPTDDRGQGWGMRCRQAAEGRPDRPDRMLSRSLLLSLEDPRPEQTGLHGAKGEDLIPNSYVSSLGIWLSPHKKRMVTPSCPLHGQLGAKASERVMAFFSSGPLPVYIPAGPGWAALSSHLQERPQGPSECQESPEQGTREEKSGALAPEQ